jgi:hypothetical protein
MVFSYRGTFILLTDEYLRLSNPTHQICPLFGLKLAAVRVIFLTRNNDSTEVLFRNDETSFFRLKEVSDFDVNDFDVGDCDVDNFDIIAL